MTGVQQLAQWPEWLGTAVLGALIAALGYVAKLVSDALLGWRHRRARERTRLLQLASLLRASREIFLSQRKLVDRLESSLAARGAVARMPGVGYERQFAESFAGFTAEERDLHRLVRSITEHGLRPLNKAVSSWLDTDTTYRNARQSDRPAGQLAAKLNQLDTHLRLWHSKYAAWIPEYPDHALVYLADEESHGLGFPAGLDAAVLDMLRAQRIPASGVTPTH